MKMFTMMLLLGVATAATIPMDEDPAFPKFQAWMTRYSKRYSNQAEAEGRFRLFKTNLGLIAERNAKPGNMAIHGLNEFGDLHPDEFRRERLGYRPSVHHATVAADGSVEAAGHSNGTDATAGVPDAVLAATSSIDWRAKGALTPVKNQGQCGSCWAFSATEQIESCTFLATGKLNTLSPQQITSCDTTDLGCNGGNTDTAYEYVMSAGGIEPSKDYPYTSGTTMETGNCKFKKKDVSVDIKGFSYVSQTAKDEKKMLAQVGKSPISICVDATIWQTYVSGIITQASDCGTQLDHCVQVAGYNSAGSPPYWIVRNSWGTSWGNDGYIWVEAGHNVCGIATCATITKPC